MQDNDKKTNTILFFLYSCTAKKRISGAWHTHLLLLELENAKKQGKKNRKQEVNRPCKQVSVQPVDRLKAESQRVSRPRSIISVLTGPEKDWKRGVTLQTSLYCRSLALIEDLSDQFEEREANRREKPASKSGQVEVSCRLLVRPLRPNLRPFFSSLVATLATKLFPATTKYHYCSGSFPTRPSRDENQ